MAIRCGDYNPRRLRRIFNSLLLSTRRRERGGKIPAKEQTRILRRISARELSSVQSEPKVGPELHAVLTAACRFMNHALHSEPLSTDQVSSIDIPEDISDANWQLVIAAVGKGLLYPNIGKGNEDNLPIKTGTFRLAFVLAPNFYLLPRKGTSRSLNSILKNKQFFEEDDLPLWKGLKNGN